MNQKIDLEAMSAKELIALANGLAEFNIGFFSSWAIRLRAFDMDAVRFLEEMADDAHQYLLRLQTYAAELFDAELPKVDSALYKPFLQEIELPDKRYLVVSAREANSALSAALTMQKNITDLFGEIDEKLRDQLQLGEFEWSSLKASYFSAKLGEHEESTHITH